ncbi:TonB-dependent receptor plug domain-containing protein [Aureibaculum luteum]|uniref:TonB-dependent receptor plug domain-containing protein n=1 Tax=Aureibaculum luteum TaxID=1548456 RepID=UPI000E47EFE6|nr:TonB-dependent receptor [Aureibaculum luteum]
MLQRKVGAILLFCLLCSVFTNAQKDTVNLKEVIVTSNRISIPYFKTSRTINLITAKEIKNSTATNVVEVLQQVAGIDVRQRGVDGTQADLYIRGGSFDQTLILIDGIKMDDAQTGHHTMNAMVALDNIERIEVIKGPAARVFGQNAFAGAINIVTKKIQSNALTASLGYGSYNNLKASVGYRKAFTNGGGFQIHAQKQKSDGYRTNSDFDNTSVFLKSQVKNYNFLVSLSERKFGAENFYTSNPDWKEYEETQTSLFAVSSVYRAKNLIIKPRIYWRRNQDIFLLKRYEPSFFRNLHITNKIAAETNFELTSDLGKTGFGIDLNKVFLSSNNLGDRDRFMLTSFLEHRFEIGDLDVTPGLAFTYFSDFDAQIFPGLDVGYGVTDHIKLYGNIGYTYRIPTFTDLYYSDPGTEGNSELKPESALSEEIGFKFTTEKFQVNVAVFNRTSDDLIDYTKEVEADKWKAQNFSKVNTKGFETSVNYNFEVSNYNQNIKLGYNFIDDDIKDVNVAFTRYGLNSLKHQFTSSLHTQFLSFLDQSISFRFVERTNGQTYNLVDFKLRAKFNKFEISAKANNIFNTEYIEQGLVPMPKGNFMFGLTYNLY